MMLPMFTQTWTAAFATRMLNGAIAGIVLVFVAWMLLRLAGRQDSRSRFVLWFSILVGVAFLPFASSLGAANATSASPRFALPGSWAMIAVAVWAAIAAILLLRIAFALWELRRVRRSSRPINANAASALLGTLQSLAPGRNIELLVSPTLRVPTALGFFRPAVIFPEWTLAELSVTEQNSVLLHELAHLRRYDDWTNLAQQILKALFFFHPAVWWLERKLTLERELACDHFVLSKTDDPQVYAECLVTMAEKSYLRRGLALAQAMVGRVRQTSHRLAEILETARHTPSRSWKPRLALAGILTIVSAGGISRMPELVAFHDVATQVATVSPSVVNLKAPTSAVPTLASYVASPAQPKAVSFTPTRKPAKTPVLHVKPEATPILASLETNGITPVPPPMFVVLRSAQFGPHGEFFWSVEIFQLTVFHPAVATQKEDRAKQI